MIATHADQALDFAGRPTDGERRLLGVFGYSSNKAVLHSDPALMPKRRAPGQAGTTSAGAGEEKVRARSPIG